MTNTAPSSSSESNAVSVVEQQSVNVTTSPTLVFTENFSSVPVRDQIHAMCKSYKIESFVEPLLRLSDLFLNSHDDNFIFNLDFKNAFNSVSRNSVFAAIEKDFPELTSYFYLFYGKPSDLIYDSYSLKSMSGVKQGDPLGPLFFCLTIHDSLLCILKKYPDLKIVGYMDDISIIGPLDLLKR
ncbi:hypothetical protein GEMRC1_013490 [Eukaryota sp. GEM-RC1]